MLTACGGLLEGLKYARGSLYYCWYSSVQGVRRNRQFGAYGVIPKLYSVVRRKEASSSLYLRLGDYTRKLRQNLRRTRLRLEKKIARTRT